MIRVINNFNLNDVFASIKYLLQVSSVDENIRRHALEITAGKEPIPAIFDWVRENVKYVPDPVEQSGSIIELFISPVRMLSDFQKGQVAAGDCDDHALLNVALLRSLGIESKVILIDQEGNGYNHALAVAKTQDGELWVDTTSPKPLGWVDHYVRRLDIE